MDRTRDLRLRGLAVLAVCLLATGGGLAGRPAGDGRPAPHPAEAALSTAVDVAVLPGRAVEEIRAAASAFPSRLVVLGAILAPLLALPVLLRRSAALADRGREPLRSRRHTIALRAPPPLRFRPV